MVLSAWPVDRPSNWTALVNAALGDEALAQLRTSVQRGRPFGSDDWVQQTAGRLGLLFTLRSPGRPRQEANNK